MPMTPAAVTRTFCAALHTLQTESAYNPLEFSQHQRCAIE